MKSKAYDKENLIRYTKELKNHFTQKKDVEDLIDKEDILTHFDISNAGHLTYDGEYVGLGLPSVPNLNMAVDADIRAIINGSYTDDDDDSSYDISEELDTEEATDEDINDILSGLYS